MTLFGRHIDYPNRIRGAGRSARTDFGHGLWGNTDVRTTAWKTLVLLAIALAGAGCKKRGAAEPFGKTFYLGGASNVDVFSSGVPEGLRQAGYRGDVQISSGPFRSTRCSISF